MFRTRLAKLLRPLEAAWSRSVAVFGAALAAGFGTAALVALPSSGATTPAQNIIGNQTLAAGQQLESVGGQYILELASNGNLEEIYNGGPVIWQTTGGVPGDHALLQPNGDLVLLNSAGQTLWSSNSAGAGCPTLDLQRDGNLVVYDTKEVFAKGQVSAISHQERLLAGWDVWSPNGFYELRMETTGNLALYSDAGKLLWDAGTKNDGNYAVMQSDGNLVVYSSANKPLWASNTAGNPGATLDMQSDGNLVIYSSAGKALWSTATHGAANNGVSIDPPGPAASATPCPTPPPAPPPPPPPPPPPTTVTSVVTVTTTAVTVETVPVPAPRPHHLRIKVTLKWKWNGAVTRLERLTVGRRPHLTRFTALYQRATGRHRRNTRDASTKRELAALIRWLERTQFSPGDRLSITLSHAGWVPERATFTIRDAELPKLSR